jgi:methylmalonyl-CoA mutase N-terminal domain/subunit
MMPSIIGAVKAYATLGEICGALREVFGSYQETARL